ncbi:cytochrome c3 family protein [Candidatus Bathyarchaeota archaeon]|nr:cytochrome c3 family protein [Candidatus Bathyarchaeota archaeon]
MKIKQLVHKKLSLAIIAVIVVAGLVGWEYTGTAEFCSLCHIVKPYYESWRSGQYLDHRHALKGVTCDDCHVEPGKPRVLEIGKYMKEGVNYVTGNYPIPLPEANLTKEYCLQCHGTYSELAQKSSNVKPNPHMHHLGEIQCTLCHKSHKPFVNHCSECHEWAFQKQGTTSAGLEDIRLPERNLIGLLLASILPACLVTVILTDRKDQP